jgi:uncharacterized membrane protein
MAKRKKILGMPIGKKKSGPNLGAWVSGVAAVAGGAVAARRAFQELRESGPVQKGKEAVGQVAEAGKKVSNIADKAQDSPIGKLAGKLGGGGGSNGSDGKGSGADQGHVQKLAWLIDEQIDVGVPRREAYNQWTQFGEFSEIFKGVENVDQAEGKDDQQNWSAKVGPSRRQFDVEITEQIPDRRIAWKASGGENVQGVVTFHQLDDELTRVNVEMVYRPQGFVEHVGNWFRSVRRRVRKDLKLFKEYVELRGEASGEWRGKISKEGGRGDAAVDGSPAPDSGSGGNSDKGSSSSRGSSSRSSGSSSRSSNGGGSSSSRGRPSGSASRSSSGGSRSTSSRSSGGSKSNRSRSTSSRSSSGSKRSSRTRSTSSGSGSSPKRSSGGAKTSSSKRTSSSRTAA